MSENGGQLGTGRRTRSMLKKAERAVVKLGTNVVMHSNGELALGRISAIVEEIVGLYRRGCRVIVVSSGAVGLGAGRLGVEAQFLPQKQACAAVGQVLLMAVYEQAFSRFGVPVAQLLLSEEDFGQRKRYLNLRNACNSLLEMGVVPIVNENDPVSTSEIEIVQSRARAFGDNDKLSALVMSKIDAEVLVVLTDVDGVYTSPGPGKGGRLLSEVEDTGKCASGVRGRPGASGRGGMQTKLEAMKIATESGGIGCIANGKRPGVLSRVFSGEAEGTVFSQKRRLSGRKRWIAFASGVRGKVVVNEGARRALEKEGASLLFAGIVSIEGEFERGDVVGVVDESGREFARGMANHASSVAASLVGKHTKDVAAFTHEPNFDVFVTRDNLAVMR